MKRGQSIYLIEEGKEIKTKWKVINYTEGLEKERIELEEDEEEMDLKTFVEEEENLKEYIKKLKKKGVIKIEKLEEIKEREQLIKPNYYHKNGLDPFEYIKANKLDFFEGDIVKYITRHRDKNGIEDLKKLITYAEYMIENYEELYRKGK